MKKITKLAVFDFDGTLCSTPLPDIGKTIYEDKTGKKWPHIGWWSKTESLDGEIFDIPLVDSVKTDYDISIKDKETLNVMITGRRIVLSTHVEKILKEHGLKFDEYHYNEGGATEVAKIKTIEMLLKRFKDIKEISMWDDRLLHIPIFEEFFKKLIKDGRIKSFNITVVPADRHK